MTTITAPAEPASKMHPDVTDDALRQARIELARLGGIARAAKLSSPERKKIATKAGMANRARIRKQRKLLKTKA